MRPWVVVGRHKTKQRTPTTKPSFRLSAQLGTKGPAICSNSAVSAPADRGRQLSVRARIASPCGGKRSHKTSGMDRADWPCSGVLCRGRALHGQRSGRVEPAQHSKAQSGAGLSRMKLWRAKQARGQCKPEVQLGRTRRIAQRWPQGRLAEGCVCRGRPFPGALFWTALGLARGAGRGCCGHHHSHFSGLESDSCPAALSPHNCGHHLQSEKTTGVQGGPLPKSPPPPHTHTSKSAPSQLSLA